MERVQILCLYFGPSPSLNSICGTARKGGGADPDRVQKGTHDKVLAYNNGSRRRFGDIWRIDTNEFGLWTEPKSENKEARALAANQEWSNSRTGFQPLGTALA